MRRLLPITSCTAALWLTALGTMPSSTVGASPRVYQCRENDTLILSDRPCGDDASLRAIDLRDMNVYAPPSSPGATLRGPGAPRRSREAHRPPKPSADGLTKPRTQSCWDIEGEIDRIDSRMRLGYTGRIGEKLRAQRRQLTDRYASRRCNTTSSVRPH